MDHVTPPGLTSPAAGAWYRRPEARSWRTDSPATSVLAFHRQMAGYAATPLTEVPALAQELNVGRVFVKAESRRFGLPAFKILGASYAIARALSRRYGLGERAAPLAELAGRTAGDGDLRLSAATDGNHGRAVARVAAELGVPAGIFVPAAITSAAKQAIAAEGAALFELELPYDDVVARAAELARAGGAGHLIVQDTSWPGYEEIPRWIADGYSTLFAETDRQLA
ncbi:MAG TPA: pyridoxal-phosphate dependent enzyme, partial [Streptosporangiaceae bacterium]